MQNLITIDRNIFLKLNSFIGKNQIIDEIVKITAVYIVYIIPILFIFFWFYKKNEKTQKFLLELFITSVISWQVIARFLGMIINRPRPSTFLGTKEVIFHPPTYSFPSDHALFLAYITAYLYFSGYKKMGNISLVVTILVSISRIFAGFHWPADVLAGWIIGAFLAYLFYLIRKPIEKYIINPLWNLAKLIKLT